MQKSVEPISVISDKKYKLADKEQSYFDKLLKEKIRRLNSVDRLNATISDLSKERWKGEIR